MSNLSDEERRRIYEEERERERVREKSPFRRFFKWLGIGCIGLVILFAGCVALVSVGLNTDDDDSSSASEETTVTIGQAVTSANWEVVVPSRPTTAKTVTEGFFEESAAGIFVIVPILVKNVGDEGSTFSDWQLKLIDERNREFDAASYTAQSAAGGGLFLEQINPGLSKSTVVAFDVSPEATSFKLKVQGALFTKSAFIDIGTPIR